MAVVRVLGAATGTLSPEAAGRKDSSLLSSNLLTAAHKSAGLKTHRADMLGAPAAHHEVQRAGC